MASCRLKPILLNNGHLMPRLGLGTFFLLGDKCQEIVTAGLEMGCRQVDTAYTYRNDKEVGTAVEHCIQRGIVKRGDIFITTKVPPTHLSPQDVKLCVEESLENLKSPYIDLLLVHSPWGLKNKGNRNFRPVGPDGFHYDYEMYNLNATWSAFEDSVKSGKVRSIGLSNFQGSLIEKVLKSCKIKPQNVQFECHLYYQQKKLKLLCDEMAITCTAYAPLGAPGIAPHHLTEETKETKLLDDEIVAKIATKYRKTPAQVLIRFLLQQDFVAVPKTSSEKRLAENLNVFDFQITESDMNVLGSLDRSMRYFRFPQFSKHPEFPNQGETF